MRTAIQGIEGSYHDLAARKIFGEEAEILPCETFGDVFRAVQEGGAERGVVAIENTVAGSLLPNYTRLRESGLAIRGEVYLQIRHCLIALPGESLETVREVRSHPMALAQCRSFLDERPDWRLVETSDTASSVRFIHDRRLQGVAAIASRHAAQRYGMEIVRTGIETHHENYTRFLVVASGSTPEPEDANKASLCFTLPHRQGSLSQALSIIAFYGFNLSKIQSLPIVGLPWQYLFYIDVEYDDRPLFGQGLDALRPLTRTLKILGMYPRSEKIIESEPEE
ncbi:MAG TPA: prephenate dehydratase domain-containing protein [bacterium]|nr:prephenate dehydratase domain-containing protein [bacterium]HPQ67353.1 prephenate dehydratase domain-containing protein [bacterium]